MKKLFVVEKRVNSKSLYLQYLNSAHYWNENISLAFWFDKEDNATEAILRLPAEEINSVFQIQKVYQKIN